MSDAHPTRASAFHEDLEIGLRSRSGRRLGLPRDDHADEAVAPVRCGRPRQTARSPDVRQEFRIEHALRGARELQHEIRGRKGNDLVGRFVVVEIVVVVLNEEDRRGTE